MCFDKSPQMLRGRRRLPKASLDGPVHRDGTPEHKRCQPQADRRSSGRSPIPPIMDISRTLQNPNINTVAAARTY